MEFKLNLLLFVAVFLGLAYGDTIPEVVTNAGTVSGTRSTVTAAGKEHTLDTFLGIPYAKPPTGNLRFAKPQPLDSFGQLEATKLGAVCPQITYPPMSPPELMSEDCLFLNIFAPVGDAQPSGRAVMLFIHGGGFVSGSADMYVGDTLATFGDVIVVTINYRLGMWGFFSTGDENAPGNLALWDQRLAIQWVNQNIGSFGGDNKRITIFGQSAGSSSVFLQALYPPNRGLFQRAIAESGTPWSGYSSYHRDVLGPAKIIAKGMNCTTETTKLMVECLRGLEYDTLLDTLKVLMKDPKNQAQLVYTAGIDNDFIKIDLNDLDNFSSVKSMAEMEFYRSIDVMVGFNSVEGASFMTVIQNFEKLRPSRETMRNVLTKLFGFMLLRYPDPVLNLIMSEYTYWKDPENPEIFREQIMKIFGDYMMGTGSVEYIRGHSNTSEDVTEDGNSYLYYFTPRPTTSLALTPSWVQGANHGDELGFVFGFDEGFISEAYRVLNVNITTPKDWEYRLSYLVMSYWTNFAKTGNPNAPMSVDPEWPSYNMANQSYLEINKDTSYAKQYLRARETNFWANVLPEMEDAVKQASPNKDSSCTSSGSKAKWSRIGLFVILCNVLRI